jgi:Icc-related predicted phosphoesterase
MNTSIRYHELQSYFHGLRLQLLKEDMLIEDFVDELLENPEIAAEMQRLGNQYKSLTSRAYKVMQQKYTVLGSMIMMKQRSRVFCLPGNYDMDLKATALHEQDLHLHCYPLDDLRICGYGGADIRTPGIPERYIVHSRGKTGHQDWDNEMCHFFQDINPDIIVTHQPAYGIHDQLSSGGPVGSMALRTYCEDNKVMMCLTGHVHRHWGVQLIEGTLFLNPSNFGEITQISGDVTEGGFYYSISVENKKVQGITFKKFYDGRIYDVAVYSISEDKLVEKILDSDRYEALQKGKRYDLKVAKESHIPEIMLYNEIKHFYRSFQTSETEERLHVLEDISALIEEKLHADIAMDVMGSVNFGISMSGSDIDMVLYSRCDYNLMDCRGKCVGGSEACAYLDNAEEMIREILKDKYAYHILDYVDINRVENAIREKNYESDSLLRFVSYRSISRPINYRAIAPTEDMLNRDMTFRKEVEGSLQAFFKIITATSRHIGSFMKYEQRLSSLGIKLPAWIRDKVKLYLGEPKGARFNSP